MFSENTSSSLGLLKAHFQVDGMELAKMFDYR